jgi:hypothetical protein
MEAADPAASTARIDRVEQPIRAAHAAQCRPPHAREVTQPKEEQ